MDANLDKAMSAAGLVLAVLAALYTLWLPTVTAAVAIVPERDADNREGQRTEVVSAIFTKALPLAAASVATSIILLPRIFSILRDAVQHHSDWQYDDVKALLMLTYVLLVVLTVVSVVQLLRLIRTRLQLG